MGRRKERREDSDDVVLEAGSRLYGAHALGGAGLADHLEESTQALVELLLRLAGLGHEGHEVLLVEAHPLNHHLADLALAVLDAGLVGVIDVGVEVEEAEADAGLVGPLDHGANLVRVARVHVVEAVRDHHDVDVRLGATLGLEPVREEHCTWCFLEDTPVQRGHSTLGLRGVLAAFEPR